MFSIKYNSLSRYCLVSFIFICSTIQVSYSQKKIDWWLTSNDKSALLSKQKSIKFSKKNVADSIVINIDEAQKYQEIDGFGFALTGGSAQHLIKMDASKRRQLLKELFGRDKDDLGISYLRVSIGASDLNDHVFSYNDLKDGETDPALTRFNLGPDERDVIPILKEILT
ncbi:MAG: glucosylceramidase, partial [Pedobacter sp.]